MLIANRGCYQVGGDFDCLLEQFMKNAGLGLGHFALTNNISPDEYFGQYGLSDEGFRSLYEHSPRFRWSCRDVDATEALSDYMAATGLSIRWIPRHLHLLEKIAKTYPQITWEIYEKQKWVVIDGFPRFTDFEFPHLYELVSGTLLISENYVQERTQTDKIVLVYGDDNTPQVHIRRAWYYYSSMPGFSNEGGHVQEVGFRFLNGSILDIEQYFRQQARMLNIPDNSGAAVLLHNNVPPTVRFNEQLHIKC